MRNPFFKRSKAKTEVPIIDAISRLADFAREQNLDNVCCEIPPGMWADLRQEVAHSLGEDVPTWYPAGEMMIAGIRVRCPEAEFRARRRVDVELVWTGDIGGGSVEASGIGCQPLQTR